MPLYLWRIQRLHLSGSERVICDRRALLLYNAYGSNALIPLKDTKIAPFWFWKSDNATEGRYCYTMPMGVMPLYLWRIQRLHLSGSERVICYKRALLLYNFCRSNGLIALKSSNLVPFCFIWESVILQKGTIAIHCL